MHEKRPKTSRCSESILIKNKYRCKKYGVYKRMEEKCKNRTCVVCKEKFDGKNYSQLVCSMKCRKERQRWYNNNYRQENKEKIKERDKNRFRRPRKRKKK